MKSLFLFISIAALLVGCANTPEDRKWKSFDKAQFSFARKVKKERNLFLESYGLTQIDGKVEVLELSFNSKKQFSLEELPEARKLLFDLSFEFLDEINANEELRPHLIQYPFTLQNVQISAGSDVSRENKDKYLVYFGIYKNVVSYSLESEKDVGPFRKYYIEKINEALTKLNIDHDGKPLPLEAK
ncbi:MAG: hypothetical protein P0S95_03535 [Rhabdochlamydiaceae bacterium]|nr:hypothetical protein [Candidatus Amphrikana amoebophyrae]